MSLSHAGSVADLAFAELRRRGEWTTRPVLARVLNVPVEVLRDSLRHHVDAGTVESTSALGIVSYRLQPKAAPIAAQSWPPGFVPQFDNLKGRP